jgi:transcriptional regulator with XRE-family HTH domain
LTQESNFSVNSATGTSGGNHLRALREYARKTQLDVELDASLGTGYLQRVESGKVRHPERATLERILTALEARYTERRAILELFGYVVDAPLPDESEMAWAKSECQQEINSAVFPAYLLDCGHRMLSWNAFAPRLYHVEIFPLVARQKYASMLRIVFDPAYEFAPLIANPEVFFPAQIRAFRYERYAFRNEAWNQALVADMLNCALFAEYWYKSEAEPAHSIPARPLVPLEVNLPDAGLLRFRLMSEPFAQDRRFRVIYLLPADAPTMQTCLAWME